MTVLPIEEFSVQICKICERELPLSEFGPNKAMRLGLKRECKKCLSEKAMRWVDKNPDRALNAHLRRRFGITLDDYNAILADQGGVCAVCGKPPVIYSTPGGRRRQGRQVKPRLVVDHDHETGKVRGLLCVLCNRGIGFLQDNPEILRQALEYLENNNGRELCGNPCQEPR